MSIYNYSNLSISQLIEKIGKARFFNLPLMLKEVLTKINNIIFGDAPIECTNYAIKNNCRNKSI